MRAKPSVSEKRVRRLRANIKFRPEQGPLAYASEAQRFGETRPASEG